MISIQNRYVFRIDTFSTDATASPYLWNAKVNPPLPPIFPVPYMIGHSHLAVIEKHAIHFLDGTVGSILSLKVDKSVALGSIFITHHLERRDTWESIDPRITCTYQQIAVGALTLQERMLPKAEKVSYSALLSMDLSRFLMNTLPTPDFLREGSLWDHMIRIGFPLTTSKFMVSKALSADRREQVF